MIRHPGVLALLLASALVCLLLLVAAWHGLRVLQGWDLQSGSEAQLDRERRTYLVSTLVGNALALEVLTLFLFIFTADRLHAQFVGAMCAAGTLSVTPWGYPALLAKAGASLLCGVWLVLHRVDTQAHDYPLLRPTFLLLFALVPAVLLEAWLQARHLTGLRADVMTSCCGSLFGQGQRGLASELAGLAPGWAHGLFWGALAALLATVAAALRRGRGHGWVALASLAFLPAALVSLISLFCLYIYGLPSHHCPFCLLQRPYGFIGYALYGLLLLGTVAGIGAGLLAWLGGHPSLAPILPRVLRRLLWTTLLAAFAYAAILGAWLALSPLRL